jgi:hypothetical protein
MKVSKQCAVISTVEVRTVKNQVGYLEGSKEGGHSHPRQGDMSPDWVLPPPLTSLPPINLSDHLPGKSYPCNRPWRPIGSWDVEAPTFSLDNRITDGGEVVSLMRQPLFTPKKIPGTHLYYRLSQPQGHSVAGRIRWIEKNPLHHGSNPRPSAL